MEPIRTCEQTGLKSKTAVKLKIAINRLIFQTTTKNNRLVIRDLMTVREQNRKISTTLVKSTWQIIINKIRHRTMMTAP